MKKEKTPLAVSACLLGQDCKYNGGNNALPEEILSRLWAIYDITPVCPEQLGGLPTPRTPAERRGDAVISAVGADVTKQFTDGATATQKILREKNIKIAVLKSRSPSCGKGKIYDGSFTGTLVDRNGVTTELLQDEGVLIYTEEEIQELL